MAFFHAEGSFRSCGFKTAFIKALYATISLGLDLRYTPVYGPGAFVLGARDSVLLFQFLNDRGSGQRITRPRNIQSEKPLTECRVGWQTIVPGINVELPQHVIVCPTRARP
jgi:hypothetical protein